MQDVPLSLSLQDRVEDRIALAFYRTLYEAPRALLGVKHSFYFNETYGEAPQDRRILERISDEALRAEVLEHLDDEVRHAQLWRDYLEARGELPEEGSLPFGDFVGMLRAAGWLPAPERLAEERPLEDEELMAFFAIIHVVETQAVRQMVLFRKVLRERGDSDLDTLISSILRDEGRHMAYSKRALHRIGAKGGARGEKRAKELEHLAFRAFLRLRSGDMRKILRYVFEHDRGSLSASSRLLLRGLSSLIGTFPTKVPGPDGRPALDAALPLEDADARGGRAHAA